MNILKNKWFILGNMVLLLAVIPITLFVVKNQTNTKSKAAPTTNLSFNPSSATVTVGQNTTLDVMVDPGSNIVSIVELNFSVDPSKLSIVSFTPNSSAFPVQLKSTGPNQDGTMSVSLSTSQDVQKAIQSPTKVGILTVQGVAATGNSPTTITINKATSQVFSLASSDGATENVLNDAGSASVTVNGTIASNPSPTPSQALPSLTPSPTASPTGALSQNPVCTSLSIDKQNSGIAPYSLMFTAVGSSQTSTIDKVDFNFGDGQTQEATSSGGIGTNTINLQLAHTYDNPGSYSATATITDATGLTSDPATCTQNISVTAALAANPSSTPTATVSPTLPVTGTVENTFAILGVVGTVIGVGIFLFVL